MVKPLLESATLICHNWVFEARNVRALDWKGDGPRIDLDWRLSHDSMIQSYVLSETPVHGLKDLTMLRYSYEQAHIDTLFGKKLTSRAAGSASGSTCSTSTRRSINYVCDDVCWSLRLDKDQRQRCEKERAVDLPDGAGGDGHPRRHGRHRHRGGLGRHRHRPGPVRLLLPADGDPDPQALRGGRRTRSDGLELPIGHPDAPAAVRRSRLAVQSDDQAQQGRPVEPVHRRDRTGGAAPPAPRRRAAAQVPADQEDGRVVPAVARPAHRRR